MALKLKKIDESKSLEAQWCQFDADTKVLVMPLDNPQYVIALSRAMRKISQADALFQDGEVGVIEGEKSEGDTVRALLAKFIIQDWSGAEDENGNPLAYNAKVGAEMLRTAPGFMQFVNSNANRIALENAGESSSIEGKSLSDTDGSLSQEATKPETTK